MFPHRHILAVVVLLAAGCASTKTASNIASVELRQAKSECAGLEYDLKAAKSAAVGNDLPTTVAHIDHAIQRREVLEKHIDAALPAAEKNERSLEKSRASNTLTWWAVAFFVAGALFVAVGAFLKNRTIIWGGICTAAGGASLLVFAVIADTIAEIIPYLVWTGAAVLVVWIGIGIGIYVRNRRQGMSVEDAAKDAIEDVLPGQQFEKKPAGAVEPALSETHQ